MSAGQGQAETCAYLHPLPSGFPPDMAKHFSRIIKAFAFSKWSENICSYR